MKKDTKNKIENAGIIIMLVLSALIILSLGFVSAVNECGNDNSYLGTFKQGSSITLKQPCDDCTYVNLSAITEPNSTSINYNLAMTKNGIEFSINSSETKQLGCYSYTVYGDKGGTLTSETIDYEVTYNGDKLTSSKSVLYFGLFIIIIFFFILTIFGINKLPNKNARDEEGQLISISWLKYARSTLWFFEWMFIVAIFYLTSNLAFAYLGEQLFAKILFVMFRICFGFTLPIVLVWFVWIFFHAFEDFKLKKMMDRGMFGSRF